LWLEEGAKPRFGSEDGRPEARITRRLRVIDRDQPTGDAGRVQTPERLPHNRRLAGLARTGHSHNPGRSGVVGDEADEVFHMGTFVEGHGGMITRCVNMFNG